VNDSRRLSKRWDDVLARQLGDRLDRVRAAAEALPDDWAEQREQQIMGEWNARKAEVCLARIPLTYRQAMPHHDLTRRWMAAYRAGRRHNFVITGPSRTGKTWEAAAIACALLRDAVPVLMIEAPEMMATLRPGADGNVDIGQYQVTPVLVIDDLGAEKATDWTSEQLYRVLNFRANRKLPVIITTNLDVAGFRAHCGERVYRRIADDAGLLAITTAPPGTSREFGAGL
jgi:DNA replication protein DnaC